MGIYYTLKEIENGINISPKPKLAVIGNPISHSKSPEMHNALLEHHRIDTQYIRICVEVGEVGKAFSILKKKGFIGANVTIPHKEEAFNSVDILDEKAKWVEAINTVCFEGAKTLGLNTDLYGLSHIVENIFSKKINNLSIAILGAGGGAGKAVVWQSIFERAKKIILINRTKSKLVSLQQKIDEYISDNLPEKAQPHLEYLSLSDDNVKKHLENIDVIVQATSLGLKENDSSPLPKGINLRSSQMAIDLVYRAGKTEFIRTSEKNGLASADGLPFLIAQGAYAFETWFPSHTAHFDIMKEGLRD